MHRLDVLLLFLSRRDALWAARALKAPAPLSLFGADGEGGVEPVVELPRMTLGQEVIEDYLALRLSLRAHPMEILRPTLPESQPHERLAQAKGRLGSKRVSVCSTTSLSA